MKYLIVLVFLFFNATISFAQSEELPFVKRSFVIIKSTKNYNEASTFAKAASKQLNIPLDLRDLKPHKTAGLTDSKKGCEDNGWDYPCYVPRGREGEIDFVSIDWSNVFKNFAKGYYIVIAACGNKAEMQKALQKIKKKYKDAYVKEDEVYMGCMH